MFFFNFFISCIVVCLIVFSGFFFIELLWFKIKYKFNGIVFFSWLVIIEIDKVICCWDKDWEVLILVLLRVECRLIFINVWLIFFYY